VSFVTLICPSSIPLSIYRYEYVGAYSSTDEIAYHITIIPVPLGKKGQHAKLCNQTAAVSDSMDYHRGSGCCVLNPDSHIPIICESGLRLILTFVRIMPQGLGLD
jgi:hypothetical protein